MTHPFRKMFRRQGATVAALALLAMTGVASAVSPHADNDGEAEKPQAMSGQNFIKGRVVEAATWQNGYDLVDGVDDYAVAERPAVRKEGRVLDITPKQIVAGAVIETQQNEKAAASE